MKDENVKDEHVKDAAQDVAEDVTEGVTEDVAGDVFGVAEDRSVKVFILSIVPSPSSSGGTHAQHTRAPMLALCP